MHVYRYGWMYMCIVLHGMGGCMNVYVPYGWMHVHIYVCMVCVDACIHTCMYGVCGCLHAYIYVCMYMSLCMFETLLYHTQDVVSGITRELNLKP